MNAYKSLQVVFAFLRRTAKYSVAGVGALVLILLTTALMFGLGVRIMARHEGLSTQPPITQSEYSYPSIADCINAKSIEAEIFVKAAGAMNISAPTIEKRDNANNSKLIIVRYYENGEPFIITYFCGAEGAGVSMIQRDPGRE